MLRKTLCAFIIAMLALNLSLPFSRSIINPLAVPTLSIINPGPDGYPLKWNASTTDRGFGTPNFIFYSNETYVNSTFVSTFFLNVTVRDVDLMKAWGIGIIYSNETLAYMSAWRPSDNVFNSTADSPVRQGWTIIAPSVVFQDINATHKFLKWGCYYITPEDEHWCFNGTGQLAQIQFSIIRAVNETERKATAWLAFDPDWTTLYKDPTGEITKQMESAYFEYSWPERGLDLIVDAIPVGSGTTNPSPGTRSYAPNTNVTVTAINYTGYDFDHWELNGTNQGSINPITINMTANYNLTAVFKAQPKFILAVQLPEGTGNATIKPPGYDSAGMQARLRQNNETGNHIYFVNETQVNVTTTPGSGYVFRYMLLDSQNITDTSIIITMNRNYTLKAFFGPTPVRLTIKPSIGGTTDPPPGTYSYPYGTSNVSTTAKPNPGFTFKNWTIEAFSAGVPYNTTSTENPINMTMGQYGYDINLTAIFVDDISPDISTPTQNPPAANVQPNQPVKVSVNVTDLGSGVKNVNLLYANDTTWFSIGMTPNATSQFYEATILGQDSSRGNITVKYRIEAYDNATVPNKAINPKNVTQYYSYRVPDYTPPVIVIVSPTNTTYNTASVPLNFTLNEATSSIGYSLDGQANVTITGNATLSELSDGSHRIIVYATDTSGNEGASTMVYFSVSTQVDYFIWVIIAIVIIVVAAVLVYWFKFKKAK